HRPRSTTTSSASSNSSTPATVAATYSPTLCPAIASGSTPQLRHNSANPHSTANSAGCVSHVCFNSSLAFFSSSPACGYNASRRSTPSFPLNCSAHRSTALRYTSSLSYNSRPITTYC